MSLLQKPDANLLRARYHSLVNDVPVVIFTAISALTIQMVALQGEIDWKFAILPPMLRLVIGVILLWFWYKHRHDQPPIENIRKRLDTASTLLILAGLFTFWRSLYLFPITGSFSHYFLIVHNTLYGLCFAFILSKLGAAAYAYNVLLIGAAVTCVFRGDIEHPYLVAMLILVFEVGMLLTMRASNKTFDQWVNATFETQSLLKENQRLAQQDVLTALPNRRQFFLQAAQQQAESSLGEHCFVVGILDLDHFKPINDQYGHHIGDLVLSEVGKRLAAIHTADVQFYRLGGDEFAFHLLSDCEHLRLKQVCAEISHALSQAMHIDERVLTVSASIGACSTCDAKLSAQTMYEHADQALYQVKRAGRGHLQIYSEPLDLKKMA